MSFYNILYHFKITNCTFVSSLPDFGVIVLHNPFFYSISLFLLFLYISVLPFITSFPSGEAVGSRSIRGSPEGARALLALALSLDCLSRLQLPDLTCSLQHQQQQQQ